jgi:hypothetical protein
VQGRDGRGTVAEGDDGGEDELPRQDEDGTGDRGDVDEAPQPAQAALRGAGEDQPHRKQRRGEDGQQATGCPADGAEHGGVGQQEQAVGQAPQAGGAGTDDHHRAGPAGPARGAARRR